MELTITDMLLRMCEERMATIREQAERIGALEARVEYLEGRRRAQPGNGGGGRVFRFTPAHGTGGQRAQAPQRIGTR